MALGKRRHGLTAVAAIFDVRALGGALAGVALLSLTAGTAVLAGDLAGVPPIHGKDVLILIALPIAIVILATWVARAAVLGAMRQSI